MDVQLEITKIRNKNWNAEDGCWMQDDGLTPATPEQIVVFQRKVRLLKFAVADAEDRKALTMPSVSLLKKIKLGALVQRRDIFSRKDTDAKCQAALAAIGKTEPDGILFTFGPPEPSPACGHEDMETQMAHNEDLSKCDTQTEVFRKRNTHTIGNLGCQACTTILTDHQSPSELGVQMAHKELSTCPRFLTALRTTDMLEYIDMLVGNDSKRTNKICYAGLLHVEMRTEEIQVVSVGQTLRRPLNNEKGYMRECIILTYKCDTCGYSSETLAPYDVPEPIKAGEVIHEE